MEPDELLVLSDHRELVLLEVRERALRKQFLLALWGLALWGPVMFC
jgi:hypothetical protein